MTKRPFFETNLFNSSGLTTIFGAIASRGRKWSLARQPSRMMSRSRVTPARSQNLNIEAIEPRVLMSSDISYTFNPLDVGGVADAADGFDLTLRVVDDGGQAKLQLYNNESNNVVGSSVLDGAVTINLTGGELDDKLTIDLALPAGVSPGAHNITVLFDGVDETVPLLFDDTIAIAPSSADVYAPDLLRVDLTNGDAVSLSGQVATQTGLEVNAKDGASIAVLSGAAITADADGHVTLDSSLIKTVTGDANSLDFLQIHSAEISVTDAAITAGTIDLYAHIDLDVTINSASAFGGSLNFSEVLPILNSAVKLDGATLTATDADLDPAKGDAQLRASSDVTTVLTRGGDGDSDTSTDAGVAVAVIHSDVSVEITNNSSVTAQGDVSVSASNTVNATTTADGTLASSAGAMVAVTTITGSTGATVDHSTLDGASISVSATSDRRATTLAKAAADGSTEGGAGNDNESEARLKDPNKDGNTSDSAQTGDGSSVDFAATVAVSVLTGDTTVTIDTATLTSDAAVAVASSAKAMVSTTADGSFTEDSAPGVGVGVAVGVHIADAKAEILGLNSVTAPGGMAVSATIPESHFDVTAKSGASGGSSGLAAAGALAINVTMVDASARLATGATIDLHGGNLTLTATSHTETTATATANVGGGGSTGIGASIAINYAENDTNAVVATNAQLDNVNTLALDATATHKMTTTATGGAEGGTAITPVAALSFATYKTEAKIESDAGGPLVLDGALSLTASNTTDVQTTATGATESSGSAAIGASFGLAINTSAGLASIDRNVSAGGAVSLTGRNRANTKTSSSASASGSEDKGGGNVDNQASTQRSSGDAQGTSRGGGGTSGAGSNGKASTSEGPVAVAAAVTVNVVDSDSGATIGAGRQITSSGGGLTLLSQNNTDTEGKATGEATKAGSAGVGVAVALNTVDIDNIAEIQSGAAIDTTGISVKAEMLDLPAEATDTHTSLVEAKSGAGAKNVGVAGGVGINLVDVDTTARIGANATLTPHNGDIAVQAVAITKNKADALPEGKASGSDAGIGASVAFQLIDTTTLAEIMSGGSMVGQANDLTVTATASHLNETNATHGAAGDNVAIGGAVAVAIVTNTTTARVESGGAYDALTGSILIDANHTSTTNSLVKGDVESDSVGIGIAVTVNVVNETVEAKLGRTVATTGGSATVAAHATVVGKAEATASAGGGKNDGENSDKKSDDAVNQNANKGQDRTVPKAGDSQSSGNSQAQGQSGTGASGVGIAAAAAVNAATVTSTAQIANGADVSASGPVVVRSQASVDENAQAVATAVDFSNGDVNIGAAVGLNIATLNNRALVGAGSAVTGSGITIEAVTPLGQRNDYSASAYAAGGNKSGSVAGSAVLALNVVMATTVARSDDNADLNATGGDISVTARHSMAVGAVAASAGASLDGVAFGAAAAMNLINVGDDSNNPFDTGTFASIGNGETAVSGASAQATGAISVSATTTITHLDVLDLPTAINSNGVADPSVGLTSLAVAAGASSGNAAVAGSASINVIKSNTRAYIDDDVSVPNSGSISVAATDTLTLFSLAGSVSISADGVGIGAGLDLAVITKNTRAYVGAGADLHSDGDISITANSTENITSVAANGGVSASSVGMAVSASVVVLDTKTFAGVNDGTSGDYAELTAGGNVTIHAQGDLTLKGIGGAVGVGSSAGIGGSNQTLIHTDTVEAAIGNFARVTSSGAGATTGVEVSADSNETIVGIAAAGAAASSVAVSGSATVNLLTEITTARVGRGAHVTTSNPSGTPDLVVKAEDVTTIVSVAGSLAAAGSGAVGVGVDVATFGKTTKAYIDSGVITSIDGDIDVDANAVEDVTSVAFGFAASGSVSVTADGSVQVFDNTTRAFIGDEDGIGSLGAGDVHASGSVRIVANDSTEVDKVIASAAFAGGVGVSAAAGVTVSNKTTEAYIGKNAKVSGDGNTAALLAPTGGFDLNAQAAAPEQQYVDGADNSQAAGIEVKGSANASAGELSATGEVAPPTPIGSGDGATNVKGQPGSISNPNLGQNVRLTPTKVAVQGVIVGATSNDDIESYSFGVGGGSVAVAVAASVNVVNATTTAFIDDGADVDSANHDVIVVSGNDFRHTAAAAAAAVGGVGVAPGVDITVSDNHTKAEIRGANVTAGNDVRVVAKAAEDILLVGVGIGGGTVGIGGGVNVLVLNTETAATMGGTVRAGGDAVVRAVDDTSLMLIDGGLGVGYVGVGFGVGVVVVDKHTSAIIADGADVTALGQGTGETVVNGTISGSTFNTTEAHGVIVDAASSEDLFHLAIAGGGGFVGAAGAITVDLISSETKARIGNADINKNDNALASSGQDVFVNAANRATIETYTLGVAGGVVGIGGSVDVGTLNNNTSALIDNGADVWARDDINVNSVAYKSLDGVVVSAGGGFVGVAGSVSVWSIGTQLNSEYKDKKNDGSSSSQNSLAGGSDNVSDEADLQASETRGKTMSHVGALKNVQSGKTGERIEAGTNDASDYVNSSEAATSDFSSQISAAPPVIGTSAIIANGSATTADGDIGVRAAETVDVDTTTGGIGGGAVGAAAGISILNLATNVTAAGGGIMSAGGAIVIHSEMRETIEVDAFAVGAGAVGLGAGVAVINNTSTNTAMLSDGGIIVKAASVEISATTAQTATHLFGGQFTGGAAGIGAVWVDANFGGFTTAKVGVDAEIGQTGTVGSLQVTADSTIDVEATVVGVSGGAGLAVGANFGFVEVHPAVTAKIDDGAAVTTSGAINVYADTHHDASATVTGASVAGGVGVALSWTSVTVDPTVTSALGLNAVARSNNAGVNFRARHNASQNDSEKKAYASAIAAGGGVGIGAGAGARAQAINSATVSATGATGSHVVAAGASGFLSNNIGAAEGRASGGSGSLGGSIAFMSSTSKAQGASTASFDGTAGDSNGQNSLAISANAQRSAVSNDFVIALGGLFGGAAALGEALAGGNTLATLGANASIDIGGDLSVTTATTDFAKGKVEGGAGGLIGGALLDSHAEVGGKSEASIVTGAEVLGAANVKVEGNGSSTAAATTTTATGGAVSAGGAKARVDVKPTVNALVGENVSIVGVGGFVRVKADLSQSEGDATAAVYGGGLAQIGGASAIGEIDPTVAASIGKNAHIEAGGSVTVQAASRRTDNSADFGDTFNAGTSGTNPTDYGNDIIFFRSHGLATGDTVVYRANGQSAITTAGGGTLTDGREYTVIVRGDNTLTLGNQFDGDEVEALQLFYLSSDVQEGADSDRDMIRFSTPHKFVTGDAVRYDTGLGVTTIGIAEGTYYVRVVDDFTVQLFATKAGAEAAPTQFGVGPVAANRIDIGGFADGDRVTYRDPEPVLFRASGVDADLSNNLPNGSYTAGSNTIFVGANTFNNGDKIIYRTDGAPISGLMNNGVYYIIKDNADPLRIKLALSPEATDPDDADDDVPITPIAISGSNTIGESDANKVKHWLTRPSLGELVDGTTYVVINSGAGGFQLAAPGTAVPLNLSDVGRSGTFSLSKAGLNIAAASGSNPHELIIDMTGGSGNQILYGPGDISLRVIAPPAGDGTSSVSAKGGGGGGLAIGFPSSSIVATPSVTANIGADLVVAGDDVEVKSYAQGKVTAYTENAGGGFIQVGTTDATAKYNAENNAFIGNDPGMNGTGVDIVAQGDVFVTARTDADVASRARSVGGGFLAFADSDSHGAIDQGVAGATAVIGNNANVSGRGIAVNAGYDAARLSVTARSEAGGFTGTSIADAYDNSGLAAGVRIGGGAKVDGREGVDLRVLNFNIYDKGGAVNASASFYGLSIPDDTDHEDGTLDSSIVTDDNALIIAAPRISGDTALDTTDLGALPSLALLSEINSPRGGMVTTWNADVVLQSGPSPTLVVNSAGKVVKAINVTVDGGHGVDYQTNAGSFNVDDIINDDRGQAMFKSSGGSISEAAAGFPLFTFRDTYREVTLTNESDRTMIVNDVDVINRTATTPAHEVFIRIPTDIAFEFDVTHDFKPTVVTVENTRLSGGAPDIQFAGDVNNPIGITLITNQLGDIYSVGTGVVRTDTFAIFAATGSVGTDDAHRLRLEIVESNDGPTGDDRYRRVDAAQNVYLDVRGLQRRALAGGETADSGFTTDIDRLQAGGDVNLRIQHGKDQTTLTTVDYQIEVDQSAVVIAPTPSAVDTVRTHFRSTNEPGSVTQLFPLGVFGTGNADTNVTYLVGQASDNAKRIIAGNDIDVLGPTSGALTHFTAFTNILALGNIDVITNGDITLTEVTGDLRVGRIASIGRDVNLHSPRRILDALSGTQNTGDQGVGVEADVTGRNITMTAGDNGIGGQEGTGGIGTRSNFLEINVDVLNGAGSNLGVLRAFDTASGFNTEGIFITEVLRAGDVAAVLGAETAGDLKVHTVDTKGDVTLATQNGSIVDARNNGAGDDAADVFGNTINLFAQGGGIGSSAGAPISNAQANGNNDLEIDSQFYASGTIAARATGDIYVTEVDEEADVVLLQSSGGNIRFTVRESAVLGEDLNLLHSGSVLFLQNQPEAVPQGFINAQSGSILLRVGDNVNTNANARIVAARNVDIYGDFARTTGPVFDIGDPGYGTIMHLAGEITSGPNSTYLTRIFGNADADTINFDQTYLGGLTRAFGSNTPTPAGGFAPLGDNEDLFNVNQLQTMNVAGGDTLTLDGQSGTDFYVINTTGSQGAQRDYVINVLDSGAANDGVDILSVYGADSPLNGKSEPNTPYPTDDIFLLRRTSSLPGNETAARNALYQDSSAFVALLHGTLAQTQTSDPSGDPSLRPQSVQRINYDAAINGRLEVFGLGGNDYFASDDNAAITTLDGGLGDDSFQVGQLYGLQRDASEHQSSPIGNTFGGSLSPKDVFGTVATTRGWLSRGNSESLVAVGGTGDDTFTVYSNQAATRLEGNDGNDLFVVRAFALAETTPDGEIDWIDPVAQIARPKLTSGFSTAAETDIRTGSGNNQVQYNINAPVSIDGGNGFDKVVVLGTEFADHIVVTEKGVFGGGLTVSYANVEVLEIDTLEGDDTIDVLSTAPGMATRVIGGLGSDSFNVAGDVTGDVFSRDIEGTSGTINHDVRSLDTGYDGKSVPGIDVTVARGNQGQVIIDESGGVSDGFTDVREGGAADSYRVYLAQAPTSNVYVTISVADSPQDEQVASLPDGDPRRQRPLISGQTVVLSEVPPIIPAVDYDRHIILNGVPIDVPKHSIVMVFTPAAWDKNHAQTVSVSALDDDRAEGDRVIVASTSVLSADANFDHAVVRNVEITVHDNDQPDIVVTQLDPTTPAPTVYGYATDRDTQVLEGATAAQEVIDLYAIQLATAPAVGETVTIRINPSDNQLRLSSSDGRFQIVQDANGFGPGIYTVTFDHTNWNQPIIVEAHARYDVEPEDTHNTAIIHTIDAVATTDASYDAAAGPLSDKRIDVRIYDDENPGVFLQESAGKTLVVAGDTVNGPGPGDSYTIRLTKQPTDEVKVALLTDGQTDIQIGGQISYEAIGRVTPSELFNGFVSINGATIQLAPGSELMNFLTMGFAPGQLIRISGAGALDGDYTIAAGAGSVTANTITLTSPIGASGPLSDVSISRLISHGIFTGDVSYDFATGSITRTDGGSWLDNGFFEGQLIKIGADPDLYKIESFSSANGGVLNVMTLTAKDKPVALAGLTTVTQWAAVAHFDTVNWDDQLTVNVVADPFFDLAPGRENLKIFSKPDHLLSGIRGPLAIEGGTTAADRSLKAAVMLPGEGNAPFFQIAEQPPEKFQIDTLNIYNDGSAENLSGTLTSTALTGFNMGPDLVFPVPPGGMPFGEPSTFPGGISYGSIVVDPVTGQINQGNTESTVEVVNIMLGQGNDRLDILSTLVPGPDHNADGSLGSVATHGGITTVHGGGNALISRSGVFDVAPGAITRADGLSWIKAGFAVGQQITLTGDFAGSYTVTGFADSPNGPDSRLLLSGPASGMVLTAASGANLTVAVRDWLSTTGDFQVLADRIIRQDGLSWQSPGFAIGQAVSITGIAGTRVILGFDNSAFGDGTALLLGGPALVPADNLTGTVAVTDRYAIDHVRVGGDTIVVTGGAGPSSPLVVYGDTTQDGVWYAGNPHALALHDFGPKPMPHEDDIAVTKVAASIDPVTLQTIGQIVRASGSWAESGFTVGSQILVDGKLVGLVRNVTATTLTLIDLTADFTAMTNGLHDVAVKNRIGNGADHFIFPLANPFKLAGNDIIDASALFAGAPVSNLPSVGFTAYGGAGDDLIIGSQTGDHLVGGSGRDTIVGNRGVDHIYGDSGVNVDVITRLLSIPTINASVTPNRDNLAASTDELYGDARGSVQTDIYGNFDDVIFGDHGRIDQDVSGARDTTKPIPAKLQGIQTTLSARLVQSLETQNGASDIIYGNGGQDILIGGTGDDAIDGGTGVDLIFGDHASLDRWSHLDNFTSPRFQTLSGTQIYATTGVNTGSDLTNGVAQLDPRGNLEPRVKAVWGPVWGDYVITLVGHSASAEANIAAYRGNDYIAGGADDDSIFSALGNDVVQGDGSIDFISRSQRDASDLTGFVSTLGRVGAFRTPGANDPVGPLTWFASVDRASDGHDYIEAGGGNDVVFGNQGQDDIIGGSSDLYGMTNGVTFVRDTNRDKRPDGSDLLFGGSGTHILRSDIGDATIAANTSVITTTPTGHAADSDMILGDNGDIFRLVGVNNTPAATPTFLTFNYDDYTNALPVAQQTHIVVRAARLIDYTPGGVDYNPVGFATDIGARDEVHGESGDDFIYGMVGDDALYGDGQDDDIIGGYGNDWISGGTGDDGVIGDDGRIFTSRNSLSADPANPGYLVSLGESLYGIAPLGQADTDLKNTNGDVLNEFIYTPGHIQTATINLSGALKKTVDITPFSSDPTWDGSTDEFGITGGRGVGVSTHHYDDIIFGGLGSDWLHGGSGDDAISGAEALPIAAAGVPDAVQPSSVAGIPGVVAVTNLVISGFDRPYNPGNILGFEPVDADGQHSAHRTRVGEFALYDEYNPLRRIVLAASGSTQTYQFLLNFDPTEGVLRPAGTIPGAVGQQASSYPNAWDDGQDRIFGDLGNDWLVGGTGKDDLYGGLGNDLMNADDNHGSTANTSNPLANNVPDTHPFYEDRAFGGGGRDVLIGNTGGDRLIDWNGEFNSYLVPFAPFGMATVSRTLQPQLHEFLYALSGSDGADATRATDIVGADPVRNGEPFGELGLVLQKDAAWHDQQGGPSDPQAGNIPGGKRDILRSADFSNGTTQGFNAVVGSPSLINGRYQISASVVGGDAISVFDQSDTVLPDYFEVQAKINAVKPIAGSKANAYLIFDYQSPTDFKFAGINISTNKLEIGHRTANDWVVDIATPAQLKAGNDYVVMLKIEGSKATLVQGKTSLSHSFGVRIDSLGIKHMLNYGLVGIGSNGGASSQIDDVVVQAPPGAITLDKTADFGATKPASLLFTQPPLSGTWQTTTDGRYLATAADAIDPAINLIGYPVTPGSMLSIQTTMKTFGQGGIVFDYFGPQEFKYATLSADGRQIIIGHHTGTAWVVDSVYNTNIGSGTDYQVGFTLKGGLINVSLNGSVVASKLYNSVITDGGYGLISFKGLRSGQTSFDIVQIKTDDSAYAPPPELQVEAASAPSGTVMPITSDQLAKATTAAKQIWTAALGAGDVRLDALTTVNVQLGNLGNGVLGQTAANTIIIDAVAAGWGWFVDASPFDNREFANRLSEVAFAATPGSAAYGRMDLLSTLLHEMSHAMGMEHAADTEAGLSVTTESLAAGVRVLPAENSLRLDGARFLTMTPEALAAADSGNAAAEIGGQSNQHAPLINWEPLSNTPRRGAVVSDLGAQDWLTDFLGINGSDDKNDPNKRIRVFAPPITGASQPRK